MTNSNTTTDAQVFLANTYDIVIVGGGTAGLALASRLSEAPGLRIGVLEAGLDQISTDPVLYSGGSWPLTATDPKYHWGFTSITQKNLFDPATGLSERALSLPRGKMLAGSSGINSMVWMRASKAEYDALESVFGNKGWNFDSLLPYLRKIQTHNAQPSDLFPNSKVIPGVHGTEGPVNTSQNWWQSSLVSSFIKTLTSHSFDVNSNPDEGNPLGIINVTRNVHPSTCRRQDAAETYLKSTEGRDNITVLLGAHARKVIFAEGTGNLVATGVEFEIANVRHVVNATKEVVLSAGAYQSPQLLELSGIGQKHVLDKFGIETRADLPVGENLQDHMMVYLSKKLKSDSELKDVGPDRPEPILPAGLSVRCVGTDGQEGDPVRSAEASMTPDPFLVSHLKALNLKTHSNENELKELVDMLDKLTSESLIPLDRVQLKLQKHWLENPSENIAEACLIFVCVPGMAGVPAPDGSMTTGIVVSHFRPTSRGSVHIGSADPLVAPVIDLNCFNEYDTRAFLIISKFVEELVRQEPFASLIIQESPRADEELVKYIRTNSQIMYHPIGTTPMASRDLGGVVDETLVVYGTQNLRVVDAGIFPIQLSATPQASIYAVAEKAADIIKSRYVL